MDASRMCIIILDNNYFKNILLILIILKNVLKMFLIYIYRKLNIFFNKWHSSYNIISMVHPIITY